MITNIAAYHFSPLHDRDHWREVLLTQCKQLDIKGTILLAPEGINLFLAGDQFAIESILQSVRAIPGFSDMIIKYSLSETVPFNRMLVKLKKEIITFKIEGLDPENRPAPTVTPEVLKSWLDEKRDIVLLDTRNDYEVELGTFEHAITPPLQQFTEFPKVVAELAHNLRDKTVVTFCTGGVRCEKAAPYMQSLGFQDVYQLEGGILNYFEKCGGAHFRGACFVFDERRGVYPDLSPIEHS